MNIHHSHSICVDVAKNSLLAQLAMNGGPVFMQATEQEVEEKPIAEVCILFLNVFSPPWRSVYENIWRVLAGLGKEGGRNSIAEACILFLSLSIFIFFAVSYALEH